MDSRQLSIRGLNRLLPSYRPCRVPNPVTQFDTGARLCDSYGRMAIRSSMNVSLTPELEQFVQSRVSSGRYQTASEVIREGLRLLEEREHARDVAMEELRAKIRRGAEQADRGELLDGESVFEEIRQRSASRRRAKSK